MTRNKSRGGTFMVHRVKSLGNCIDKAVYNLVKCNNVLYAVL